jgi:hypothetical protein
LRRKEKQRLKRTFEYTRREGKKEANKCKKSRDWRDIEVLSLFGSHILFL